MVFSYLIASIIIISGCINSTGDVSYKKDEANDGIYSTDQTFSESQELPENYDSIEAYEDDAASHYFTNKQLEQITIKIHDLYENPEEYTEEQKQKILDLQRRMEPKYDMSTAYFYKYEDMDCDDFPSQERAQVFFMLPEGLLHNLDADGDGIACENNP